MNEKKVLSDTNKFKRQIPPNYFGSSVKYMDAFRLILTEKRSNSLNKNIAKVVNYLSYYQPLT